ncbi:MAG: TonB-dependent receptor [Porticoccaceae bacterium]|nr:TonB-dependent receptor [Porticoccaceae bacterium]
MSVALFNACLFYSLCFSPLFTSSAEAIVTDIYEVSLPSDGLHKSLVALGQQTQASIIFPSEVPDKTSPAVSGEFSVLQVLEQLIEGQDLEYRVVGPQTLVVLPRCYAARACQSMQDDLTFSSQQYPMIEELVIRGTPVTGSRFKQINTSGFTPVEILTSTEIRLTGAQTMAELMRFTPEVVGNSNSTAVSNGGNGTASVTLRGLPATNTLVLVNGQRVANNAFNGSSVDLNSIPLAAVNRIEILKDSGSSIYGSDAIAGVVNIILKKRFKGAVFNAFHGSASRGDNQTKRYDFVGGLSLSKLDLMMTASHYEQGGIFSRDRAISASADGRLQGGVDNRSSATPNARLRVGSETLVLSSDDRSGSSVADFRQATDSDLFDYQQFTSSLAPAERNSVHIAGELKNLGATDTAFEVTYVDSRSQITLAPAPILTAFTAVPFSIDKDNRYNPFGEAIEDARIRLLGLGPRLQYNRAQTTRANGRIMGTLRDGEWQLSLNWSRTDAEERWHNLVNLQNLAVGLSAENNCASIQGCVPINVFAPARAMPQEQLDFIGTDALNRGETELLSVNLDISQLVDIVPAGEVEFASGLEFRRERLRTEVDHRVLDNQLIGGEFGNSQGSQNTVEMYLESLIPIAKDMPWVQSLEANASFRLTHSNNFGIRANPKMALRYKPLEDLMLRASLSWGFRAPSLFELHQVETSTQALLNDPCSGENGYELAGCLIPTDPLRTQYSIVTGGNENLLPEKSQNLSMGFIYQPKGLENFTFGVDIFSIEVDQVIGASAQFFVNQNAQNGLFPELVSRADSGELSRVTANNQNLGSREIQGADLDISWRVFIARWGTFGVNLGGAYIDSYNFTLEPRVSEIDLAGTFVDKAAGGRGSIPEWKSRLNLFWQFGRWEFALSSLHVSSLNEQLASERSARDSGAWSREDMQVSYHFNSGESLVTLGIENVLDQMPPFLGSAFNDNFDARTHDSTGRFLYARLSHRL